MKANNRLQTNGNKGSGTQCERVWPGRCPMAPQRGPGRHPATAKRFKPMNIGCWNIRTLLDAESTDTRPERRSALVAKELQRYNMDIVALSETRLLEEGHFTEPSGGYTFYWSGRAEGCKKEAGVGFAVKTSLTSRLEQLPCGVSDRIMTMKIPLMRKRCATFISVYAPTMNASEDEKLAFYLSLKELVRKIPAADKVVVLGDFNARVGKDHETWSVLGKHGVGNCNSNGLLLLQMCMELDLSIASTMFQQKDKFKTTWMHPGSKQWHLIDYVLVRKRDIQDVRHVRVMRGAECWTDHQLVRAKLNFVIKPQIRSKGITLPKRLNVKRIKVEGVKEELCDQLENINCANTWNDLKSNVFSVCREVLGFVEKKHKDWFDDNDEQIQVLLDEKKQALTAVLKDGKFASRNLQRFKQVKKEVQAKLRVMQDTWWNNKADEIQAASNSNNTKLLYSLLREVYGPFSSPVAPLRSRDGKELLRDPKDILVRWRDHFDELLNRPSQVDNAFIELIPQRPVILVMANAPTVKEVSGAIAKLNSGKSPGMDGLSAEVLKCGGENFIQRLTDLMQKVWEEENVPQEWKDALMVVLYKGKGRKDMCGSSRGITLLSVVGKVLCRILLDRLLTNIANDVLPESQCGFRHGRGTVDMIFSARQLQEKCIEQRKDLYQVFVDLTKAFDTINRTALWQILEKLGCPAKFVKILRLFHDGMQARVNVGGKVSDPISVDNGVKQGDIPAPTLFALYFAMVFAMAFKDCPHGIYIRYRTSGKLFNLRRMGASTKVMTSLIREFLYADDCDLFAHSLSDMQHLVDSFSNACTALGLTISLDKTVLMYQPAPGKDYAEPVVYVYGQKLKVADKFVYLGSTLNNSCTLDDEISLRIGKASDAFGKLNDRLWSRRGISVGTKIKVYHTCVLSSLLYACETWVVYRKHLNKLERFHQQCLRKILGIRWQMLISDVEVLERTKCMSIESVILQHRLRWCGHVVRMDDERTPKQLLYGELAEGKRPPHKPKMRYKDCIKTSLANINIPCSEWESAALNREHWREAVKTGMCNFEMERKRHQEVKRAVRKGANVIPPGYFGFEDELTCRQCGRICLSKAGLKSHQRSHMNRDVVNYIEYGLKTCGQCGKECTSMGGLKRHMKIHANNNRTIPNARGIFSCNVCARECRSLAGLKSHKRASHV